MLSNRMTAKSLELNPARQARKRMLNESKDCHPAGCVSPPDRPPLPPPPPAAPGRLFPCTEPPELADALCLPSLTAWCSAISACGVGWICSGVPPATLRCLPPLRTAVNSVSLCPLSSGILSRESSECMYVLIQYRYSERQPKHPETQTYTPHTEPATVNSLHDWTPVERGGRDAMGVA